ncbi:MAG TPA: glycosyltransferase [Pyrinomonadaceae bacterium]|nr:glycosyltransferase [Pyrinomonadaceae bacterium]
MIKVTALTGSKHDPSSRFRVRQFIPSLSKLGIEVTEYWPLISRYKVEPLPWLVKAMRRRGLRAAQQSDVTWLGRELISGQLSFEPTAGRRKVFDVDDAIWLPYEAGLGKDFSADIVKHCDGVIAGNQYLVDHYERLGSKVWLAPTSVDTEVWVPPKPTDEVRWTIGWSGSWTNLKFLYTIEEPLAEFLTQNLDARLLVVCDRAPHMKRLPKDSWLFVPWTMENEVGLVQLMDVGLMPLENSEWALGKCGFKMLSYMSVGLPVIVSPVGVNAEILARGDVGLAAQSVEDWFPALEKLYRDRDLGKRMGLTGRAVVEEKYSVHANTPKLAEIFREVAGSSGLLEG